MTTLPRIATQPTTSSVLDRATSYLAAYSVTWLRVSLGLVIAGFGALKFFPQASPAEPLVMRTTEVLTFGLVQGRPAVISTAVLEVCMGLTLLTGRGLRAGLVAMAGWLVGIMSPIVLFAADLFPGGLPTLEAQYVLKDVILAAAGAVIAARTLGARMVPPGRT